MGSAVRERALRPTIENIYRPYQLGGRRARTPRLATSHAGTRTCNNHGDLFISSVAESSGANMRIERINTAQFARPKTSRLGRNHFNSSLITAPLNAGKYSAHKDAEYQKIYLSAALEICVGRKP